MASAFFLDTGYVIALSSPRDRYHDAALQWERHIRADSVPVVTTRAVQLEIGAAFSRLAYRAAAAAILQAFDRDAGITVVPLDDDVYGRALALFASRPDKEWSLTDCVSFVVMRDRAITKALTTDVYGVTYMGSECASTNWQVVVGGSPIRGRNGESPWPRVMRTLIAR